MPAVKSSLMQYKTTRKQKSFLVHQEATSFPAVLMAQNNLGTRLAKGIPLQLLLGLKRYYMGRGKL